MAPSNRKRSKLAPASLAPRRSAWQRSPRLLPGVSRSSSHCSWERRISFSTLDGTVFFLYLPSQAGVRAFRGAPCWLADGCAMVANRTTSAALSTTRVRVMDLFMRRLLFHRVQKPGGRNDLGALIHPSRECLERLRDPNLV